MSEHAPGLRRGCNECERLKAVNAELLAAIERTVAILDRWERQDEASEESNEILVDLEAVVRKATGRSGSRTG